VQASLPPSGNRLWKGGVSLPLSTETGPIGSGYGKQKLRFPAFPASFCFMAREKPPLRQFSCLRMAHHAAGLWVKTGYFDKTGVFKIKFLNIVACQDFTKIFAHI
jgi:hypothetical protein